LNTIHLRGDFWQVPEKWPGSTVVIICSGPSLTKEQVNYCRGKAKVIAVNNNYQLAPWADVLYYCDQRWFQLHQDGVNNFKGLVVSLDRLAPPHVRLLRNGDDDRKNKEHNPRLGFEVERRDTLKTGRNSGYQAINLALLLGAKRIILIGYDMKSSSKTHTHWFGSHNKWTIRPDIFKHFVDWFKKAKPQLDQLGIEVINCTPDSALDVFPRGRLEDVL